MKQASVLTGRDRNTIQKYIDEGMEVVQRADRDRGVPWIIDLAVLLRFCEERAAKNASERAGSSEGQMTEDEAKRRRAVAQAVIGRGTLTPFGAEE